MVRKWTASKEDVGLEFLGKSSFGDLALLWVQGTGRDGVGTKHWPGRPGVAFQPRPALEGSSY